MHPKHSISTLKVLKYGLIRCNIPYIILIKENIKINARVRHYLVTKLEYVNVLISFTTYITVHFKLLGLKTSNLNNFFLCCPLHKWRTTLIARNIFYVETNCCISQFSKRTFNIVISFTKRRNST